MKEAGKWGQWDHDEVEDLQQQQHLLPGNGSSNHTSAAATLSVTANHHGGSTTSLPVVHSQSIGGHPLEEATEYEYLRNILFQYMLGRQSKTLWKVLATVVKFSPDQVRQIEAYEDKKRTPGGMLGAGLHSIMSNQ